MMIDERLERIEASLENLTQSVEKVTVSHENLTRSYEILTKSHESLTKSHESLTRYVLDFRQETAERLHVIDNRLDTLSATVQNLDSRLPALTKAILDFGTLTSRLSREQSAQKESTVGILVRVDTLEATASRLVA
jgi:phage shock protein A